MSRSTSWSRATMARRCAASSSSSAGVEALLRLTPAEQEELAAHLRAIVARDHDVERLMDRLVQEMEAVRGARR